MTTLAEMYITLMPVMLAGILNMAWCKLPLAKFLAKPIDAGLTLWDGKRLFGDNKTWKGFLGMMALGCLGSLLWGWICTRSIYLLEHNYLYRSHEAGYVVYDALVGSWLGLAYAFAELPNSAVKRRFDIAPGKRLREPGDVAEGQSGPPAEGQSGDPPANFGRVVLSILFSILDQADSVIGMVLALALLYPMGVVFILLYICVGTVTHMILNLLLYAARLRQNPL